MTTVTLDTNIVPTERITDAVPASKFDFAVVSVTERELAGSTLQVALVPLRRISETWVMGESFLGQAVLGATQDAKCFEEALAIISNNSFPKPGNRSSLTAGQRRQLRDAMIFCAHVRARREVFVTNDARAFVNEERRAALEGRFNTRIMTAEGFITAFGSPAPWFG